jgi:hypothetical protein
MQRIRIGERCAPPPPVVVPLASSLRIFIHLSAATPRLRGLFGGICRPTIGSLQL